MVAINGWWSGVNGDDERWDDGEGGGDGDVGGDRYRNEDGDGENWLMVIGSDGDDDYEGGVW